jgi:4'-phosphopantetheinyl transferase
MTDTIDVWRIRPLRRAGDVATLKAILPPEEIARVERGSDPVRRQAAITSRAVLRLLLAHYTHIPANELRLLAGKNGKPYLDTDQNPHGITFNFSDSADMALIAVTWKREVGVDVEQIREIERAMEIASRHFSPEIAEELRKASDDEKSRVFLQNWARHEALLKAKAGTIWKPNDDKPNLSFPDTTSYVKSGVNFTVRDLDTGRDYVGALAAQGDGWSVDVKDYEG